MKSMTGFGRKDYRDVLLEPFGKGNTKPVFAQKNLRVLDHIKSH